MDKNKKKDKQDESEEFQSEPVGEVVQEEDEVGQAQELQEKIANLEDQSRSDRDQLKRAVADYINLQRRVTEEKKEFILYANRELLLSLLPAFDTLFLAAKYTTDEGVKLTVKQILEVLKNVGVEKIKTENEKFSPEFMEAVETVEGDEGMVIEETKPGFTLYGKLLQPAMVKVGSAKQN